MHLGEGRYFTFNKSKNMNGTNVREVICWKLQGLHKDAESSDIRKMLVRMVHGLGFSYTPADGR